MTEGKYITGVVIANNVPDSEGDCLDKKDIKKIFSKYLDRNTDVMHTRIKNEGVEVLANWITESDTELSGKIVPAGSWMVTFIITNESILASIENGSIGGISLGSVSEDAMTKKYWFINKAINYNDLDDMEEVIPLFISFVDKPANQYGLEIMDYNVYINKNGEKMTNEEKKEEEAMIPVSAIGKLKDIFSINKAESGEKKDEEKIDKEENVEETSDISNKELLEQLPKLVAESVKQAIVEAISAKEDEKPEKETEDDTKIDKKDNNEKSDDVSIDKRQTSMTDNVTNTEPTTSFYERTGRDHLGRKIRR